MFARNVEVLDASRPVNAESAGRRRIFTSRLMVLLLLFAYSGLSVYSGNFIPLRLVNGDSMEPTLFSGDIILLKGMPFSEIKVGDIVAYKVPAAAKSATGPTTILHRVQKTAARNGQRVLITKGDNSSTDPWPVTSSQVQGKQALRIPFLGKPVVMLTSKRGILFVSIAILISLLYIPAMVMFHVTVLKKPQPQSDMALRAPLGDRAEPPGSGVAVIDVDVPGKAVFEADPLVADDELRPISTISNEAGEVFSAEGSVAESVSPIVEAVEKLTDEQKQIRDSLNELGVSISDYATHLKSHTSAVQSLARVAELLEANIQRQTDLMDRSAGQGTA